MSTTVYVLRLQKGKYYIGKTEDVDRRFQEHLNGRGAAWTHKYKPIAIEKIIKKVSPFEEDKVTKEYMAKHGIENVRGGTYVQIELDDFHKDVLKMEIWGAKDLCTQCGRSGHFVKDCYAKKDASGNIINYEKKGEENEEEEEEWGCEYCDRTFTTEFGCGIHEKSCRKKNKPKQSKKGGTCYRCGRDGHYSPECYATRHIKGYEID